jgi:beta-galactosidase
MEGLQVKALLSDKNGQQVAVMQGAVPVVADRQMAETSLKNHVTNPLKWTSETPHLYNLNLQLLSNGQVIDEVNTRIGFKETRIIGETFYLNGVPLKVNAQNSHMQHPVMGHAMTEDVIRKDFEILKQFNFNAVRTSHYPPVNKYLELADEYGLFIIDETGDEAHASEQISGEDQYLGMYQERVRRMVLRDRNHACVLFWSAGNESGEGHLIGEVIKEGKKYDPTRSWMYGGNAYSHPAEEIIGPRYPTPEELDLQVGLHGDGDIRPSFMDEYLSVAGNGGGALDDFWRVIYNHPRTMGGAIWDFVSPGLQEPARLVQDDSPFHTPAHLMGNAKLLKSKNGTVLDLNGHDQWVEVYRADNVEISSDQLTITMQVYPRKLISSCGSFIT